MRINLTKIETVTISDHSTMQLIFIKKLGNDYTVASNHQLSHTIIDKNQLKEQLKRYLPDPISTVHINGKKLANDFVIFSRG